MATRSVHHRTAKYEAKTVPVSVWLLDKIVTETSGYDLWSTQIKPFTLIQPAIEQVVDKMEVPLTKRNILKTKLYAAWAASRKWTQETLKKKIEEVFAQMELWFVTPELIEELVDAMLQLKTVEFKVADEEII